MEARGMSADIPPDKLEIVLTQLEEERERRLQARVDAGDLVSVRTHVVVHRGESVEEATARAVARHPIPDDGRHHRELFFIYTGVPLPHPNFGQPQAQTTSKVGALSSPAEEPAGSGAVLSSAATSQPTPVYVRVVVSNGGDGNPGAIAEAWYTIEDGLLVLRDADDKHITSRALLKGEDPAPLARILLREAEGPKDFQAPIRYPKLGLA
jgi:hypothetical protein